METEDGKIWREKTVLKIMTALWGILLRDHRLWRLLPKCKPSVRGHWEMLTSAPSLIDFSLFPFSLSTTACVWTPSSPCTAFITWARWQLTFQTRTRSLSVPARGILNTQPSRVQVWQTAVAQHVTAFTVLCGKYSALAIRSEWLFSQKNFVKKINRFKIYFQSCLWHLYIYT